MEDDRGVRFDINPKYNGVLVDFAVKVSYLRLTGNQAIEMGQELIKAGEQVNREK